jgi:hypothetical protein
VAVQASMGPIADRSRENLSSSDIAVAHARRLLLHALTAAAEGSLPPGSALGSDLPRIPDPVDVIVDTGRDWRQAQPVG